MLLGVIADDFTGGSDIANTLANGLAHTGGGLRTTQFLGVPLRPAPPSCEAGVVSLKSRSIPAAEAVAQSLAALGWLRDQGCRQIVFKYCSTFDSTPMGNIGAVGEALAEAMSVGGVVACPAFPTAGRTVYQGHLFVHDRLLDESGLERHPLNPMTDPDIRRWLARQCRTPVGLAPWTTVRAGPAAVLAALRAAAECGERLVIVDAITDDDLLTIAKACEDAPLVTGGSGIALGLPGHFVANGLVTGGSAGFDGVRGPEAVLAGSCSRATLTQIDRHRRSHPVIALDVEAVIAEKVRVADLVEFVRLNEGRAPLIYSSEPPDQVAAVQARYGRDVVAHRLDSLFGATAKALVEAGVRRVVVAGGETSGAVVSPLGLDALSIGPEIDPGVPVLVAAGERPLALALKSGNFGAPDFFAKALRMLEGGK